MAVESAYNVGPLINKSFNKSASLIGLKVNF